MEPIAKICLCKGQVGYYDDYSRLYLTPGRPEAYIYPGTNTYQIKKSIKSGRLKLLEGSLELETVKEVVNASDNVTVIKREEKADAAAEHVSVSEEEAEVLPIEEKAEEAVEEPKPKRSRRKKAEAVQEENQEK